MNKKNPKALSGNKNAGFTLIELLVVVLIIGILSAVALPQYHLAVAKSRMAALLPVLKALKDAQEIYYMANGVYVDDVHQLDMDVDVFSGGKFDRAGRIFLPNNMYIDNLLSGPIEEYGVIAGGFLKNNAWDYYYALWLDRSANPGLLQCVGKSDFGRKVCKSISLS